MIGLDQLFDTIHFNSRLRKETNFKLKQVGLVYDHFNSRLRKETNSGGIRAATKLLEFQFTSPQGDEPDHSISLYYNSLDCFPFQLTSP